MYNKRMDESERMTSTRERSCNPLSPGRTFGTGGNRNFRPVQVGQQDPDGQTISGEREKIAAPAIFSNEAPGARQRIKAAEQQGAQAGQVDQVTTGDNASVNCSYRNHSTITARRARRQVDPGQAMAADDGGTLNHRIFTLFMVHAYR